ncbi:hypothetical protein NX794_04025 [Streptomyces sp. LP11]|uniref:GNAT family N-acetyltransferase n=1 Tax=Streptomyces pyxinicus TaxID=2970331 RepID=A0ABT2AVX5_9ACTN|nr:hypothetical protein [Streptomyces sp. LP11]MCS0600402.1 hypothetical protein [Streptomyces sp. LP11]
MTITVRAGGPADVPLILAMLDSSVAVVERYVYEGTPYVVEMDGTPAATSP